MKDRKILLGLTGSIGMGKSTTAGFFAEFGAGVWDADRAVAELYDKGGDAVEPMRRAFPDAVVDDHVEKDVLRRIIAADQDALKEIERIVHPLVQLHRQKFIQSATQRTLVFDIPLLFETGADSWLDHVVVVSVPADIQRARVLARPGMTQERLDHFLSKQMPDADKRERADFVIETLDLESTKQAVENVLRIIREGQEHA